MAAVATSPDQGRDSFGPHQVIDRNAGDMVTAYVQDGDVHYVGELTAAVLEEYGDRDDYSSYVTSAMRDAIASNQTLRSGRSVVVPVNGHHRCDDLIYEGLSMVVGRRIGDEVMVPACCASRSLRSIRGARVSMR
jgi:hypothetical protein